MVPIACNAKYAALFQPSFSSPFSSFMFSAATTPTAQSKSSQSMLPDDIRWCIDHKSDLSLVSYVNHTTLASKNYAVRRYKHIIKKHMPKSDRRRLLSELKFYKNTLRYHEYWSKIATKKLALKTSYRTTKLLGASVKQNTKEMIACISRKTATTINNTNSTPDTDIDAHLTTNDASSMNDRIDSSPSPASSQDPSSCHPSGTYLSWLALICILTAIPHTDSSQEDDNPDVQRIKQILESIRQDLRYYS